MRRIAGRMCWLILLAAVTAATPCLAEWKHYPAREVIETVTPSADCLRADRRHRVGRASTVVMQILGNPNWRQMEGVCAQTDGVYPQTEGVCAPLVDSRWS